MKSAAFRCSKRRVRSCLAACLGATAGLEAEVPAMIDIQPVLVRMEQDGETYDSGPLDAMGLPGLSALLDHLMPESAGVGIENPVLERQITAWVSQLADADYAVRERASRELARCGLPAREELARAAKSPDPEVRKRAREIVETLGKPDRKRDLEWNRRYGAAYRRVVMGLHDAAGLQLLARRITVALIAGREIDAFTTQGVAALTDSADDGVVDLLIPLLESDRAVSILNQVGPRRSKVYCPNLLVVALDHADPLIVHEAVTWILPCPDQEKLDAIEMLLRRRFLDPDPAIVLEIASLLFWQWGDEEAVDTLIGLAHAPEGVNIATVLRRLAHPSHCKPEVHRGILTRLAAKPLAHNEDGALWLAYNLKDISGEAAARLVIACLGFGQSGVRPCVVQHLAKQKDEAMCRRVLAEIARTHPKPETREEAMEVLRIFESRLDDQE